MGYIMWRQGHPVITKWGNYTACAPR